MKVLLIDDDPLVTSGIQMIIERGSISHSQPIQVCAIGSDGKEALSLYREHLPDIVLMDIRMKEMDGIEAGREILAYDSKANIIYLTTFLEDDYIVNALKIGAKGYILKTDFNTLLPAIEAVANGQSVFGNEIVSRIPQFYSQPAKKEPRFENLTERENELIYYIAQGLNNKELASAMHFSEGTIRNYISELLDKLQLRDRTQLAIYYYKHLE